MMTSVRGLVVIAGLTVTLTQSAAAGGPSESLLRAQSNAIGSGIETQVQTRLGPVQQAAQPVNPYAARTPVQTGPQRVLEPRGAPLHAMPAPGSSVLNHLGVGTPVMVTRPADGTGWAEVVGGGKHGYVWAPQLTPRGLPSAPWGPEQ